METIPKDISEILPPIYTCKEGAFVIDDYPYGYVLRCKMRVWIEYKQGHGFRLMKQTTDPRKAGDHWNKPKAGVYCFVAMALYKNSEGHVQHTALTPHNSLEECKDWQAVFSGYLSPKDAAYLELWIRTKEQREARGELPRALA